MNTAFWPAILTVFIASRAQGQCTPGNVENCMSDFNEYATGLPNFKRQVKWYDDTQLTELCRLYAELEDCVGVFKSQCDGTLKLVLQGVEDTYGYVCDAGYSVYPTSQDCYEDEGLENAMQDCQTQYQKEADKLQKQMQKVSTPSDATKLQRTYCEGVNDILFACMTESFYMTETCSEESIAFQLDLTKKLLIPLLEELDCSVVEQCASARVKRCTDGLVNTDSQTWDEFRARTSDEFDTLCQYYTDYETCLSPFKSQCSDKVKSSLELSDSAQYICTGEGKSVYLEHTSCLNETVEAEASVCYKRGNDKIVVIEAVEGFPTISKQEKNDYCSAINDDMLDCVSDVLEKYCDDELVKSQSDIDKAFWEPALVRVGCQQTGSAASLLPSMTVYLCSLLLFVYHQVM